MDGTPQRPPLRLRVSALILGVASLLVPLSALVSTATAQTGFIANGDFEDGLTGWGTTANADASVDSSTGGVAGPGAIRVTANTAAVVQLRSHWWLSAQITPGAGYGLEAWILDDSPEVATSLVLEFLDEDGTRIGRIAPTTLPGDSDAYRLILMEGVAPAGATYARAVIEANADAAGASFLVDAVTLAQVAGAPVVTPTIQPSPPPTPAATPGSGAPPQPTVTPQVTATPRPITSTLWNATFEDGADGWDVNRGSAELAPGLGGNALVLRANSGSTAWMDQAVTVVPGSWYDAIAILAPVEGVRSAWVRIAWYASDGASGAQMSTSDSETIALDGAAIVVAPGVAVSTGAVQAPDTARSARVRILLQPAHDSGGALAISAVAFEPSQKPAPTPTPTPIPTATPTPTATTPPTVTPSPTPSVTPSGGSGSDAPVAETRPQATVIADLEGQALLRITEVMPDAIQPGRDADYEWVEFTNLGERAVDIAGMVLRDPQRPTAMPPLVVAPGASVVIAAALAEVAADVRIEGSLGNGLGNEGDRLDLLDVSGQVVDALDYGSGADLGVSPGESVHRWFGTSGQLLGAAVGPPSPAVHEPLVLTARAAEATGSVTVEASTTATEEPATPVSTDSSDGPDSMAWVLLIALGGGALGGVAAQRIGRS